MYEFHDLYCNTFIKLYDLQSYSLTICCPAVTSGEVKYDDGKIVNIFYC